MAIKVNFILPNFQRITDLGNYTTNKIGINRSSAPDVGLHIGDGNSSRSLDSSNDVFITGKLEVDGAAYLDGSLIIGGTLYTSSAGITFYNSYGGVYGTDDGLKFGLYAGDGGANHNLIITSNDNVHKDHDHSTPSTNPTLFVHSATNPDTDNTQWISLTHNQTDGEIVTGTGDIHLNPAGNVKFGTHSAIGAETVTGYIEIKDAGGTTRKLAVVS